MMSGTRGGRGVGWFPGRGVVNYQVGYLVVMVERVLGWPFSIRVWERLLRIGGLAMAGLCLVLWSRWFGFFFLMPFFVYDFDWSFLRPFFSMILETSDAWMGCGKCASLCF